MAGFAPGFPGFERGKCGGILPRPLDAVPRPGDMQGEPGTCRTRPRFLDADSRHVEDLPAEEEPDSPVAAVVIFEDQLFLLGRDSRTVALDDKVQAVGGLVIRGGDIPDVLPRIIRVLDDEGEGLPDEGIGIDLESLRPWPDREVIFAAGDPDGLEDGLHTRPHGRTGAEPSIRLGEDELPHHVPGIGPDPLDDLMHPRILHDSPGIVDPPDDGIDRFADMIRRDSREEPELV